MPSDDLIASFDASIDALENDLEKSLNVAFDDRQSSRRQIQQQKQERQRQNHLRRLDILTSLPSELAVEATPQKCPGCGVMLQSVSPTRPGFLPRHIIEAQSGSDKPPVCQRCYRLTHYGALDPKLRVFTKNAAAAAAKVSMKKLAKSKPLESPVEETIPITTPSPELTPSKFRRCLQQLQAVNAVVIYLIDIFDFHGSFIPALRDTIGAKCPIILALNKVDLLPADYKQDRVESWIQHECRSLQMHNVNSIHFVSSIRGTGVTALLADAVRLAKTRNADIYVVGAANVGKSSFINQLIRRRKIMGLNTKPETAQLPLQNADIESEKHSLDAESGLERYEDDVDEGLYASEQSIPATRKKQEMKQQKDALTTSVIPGTTLDVVKIPLGSNMNLFDTPGLMVSHQLTNLLTEKDLRSVVPSRSVEKVSFRLSEGKCIYVGGLARIELAEGRPFFFTCFFSSDVKIHPGRADNAESFTLKHVGKMLSPPSCQEGFERLGEWTSKSFAVNGQGWKQSCVDVVLSGLGWVSITGAGNARVRVWVPKNVGVFTRSPLMPYEIRQGVSSYTGGHAFNRREVMRKKKKKSNDDDDFDLFWL